MSTQHPDNVAVPIFANGAVLSVDDEVKEAYNAFVHLGYDEQMWDFEGKEVHVRNRAGKATECAAEGGHGLQRAGTLARGPRRQHAVDFGAGAPQLFRKDRQS
jgi:hypothetical protein